MQSPALDVVRVRLQHGLLQRSRKEIRQANHDCCEDLLLRIDEFVDGLNGESRAIDEAIEMWIAGGTDERLNLVAHHALHAFPVEITEQFFEECKPSIARARSDSAKLAARDITEFRQMSIKVGIASAVFVVVVIVIFAVAVSFSNAATIVAGLFFLVSALGIHILGPMFDMGFHSLIILWKDAGKLKVSFEAVRDADVAAEDMVKRVKNARAAWGIYQEAVQRCKIGLNGNGPSVEVDYKLALEAMKRGINEARH